MKKYLGNDTFIEISKNGVFLTTINDHTTTNKIFISPDIWKNLKEFMESTKASNEDSKSY